MSSKNIEFCKAVITSVLLLLITTLVTGCSPGEPGEPDEESQSTATVKVGAELLFSDYLHLVENRRVGVITNHSALVDGEHLVDRIHQHPDIELVALFGPEHGIRGTADAGEHVDDSIDEQTGVTVYSLYGQTNRPTAEMLEGVDVLIFDIQDVGTRFYTYPATMGRAMVSAAEAGIPYLVLDRPNPIGGERIEGHIREDRYQSGIGLYPTPVTHGMTTGELALMIKDQSWHDGLEELELHVVPMSGWTREMLWDQTGLDWVPPSPNIPDVETAVVYPGTCFFEGTRASEGRGTYRPFLQVGSPFVDSEAVSADLNSRNIPGLQFHPVTFEPVSIPGMASEPKLQNETVHGVRLEVVDAGSVEPVLAGLNILQSVYSHLPESAREDFFIERGMQIRAGNDDVQRLIEQGEDMNRIADWEEDVSRFRMLRQPYLLYE